jgi:K+-transporting ATPase A subunit
LYLAFYYEIRCLLGPVSLVSALILIILGVLQTLDSSITITPFESTINIGNNIIILTEQTKTIGPVASLE